MKERLIIFSGPMIRAIREGRKTQTRRIAWKCAHRFVSASGNHCEWADAVLPARDSGWVAWWTRNARGLDELTMETYPTGFSCPYGTVGDRLWVRETFQTTSDDPPWIMYAADSEMRGPDGEIKGCLYQGPWKPSIHMPRRACRIILEVTDVRVQRLQEISPRDAYMEGDIERSGMAEYYSRAEMCHVDWFQGSWDSINLKRASWASNPWVWALTFKEIA